MSTTIEIGYFDKKVNSTKCSSFAGTTYDCLLKEGTDIKNPTVQVKGSLGNYNYAKWSSRYYWVDKVVSFPNGIFEAYMHLDPLATYKTAIKNTKAFTSFNASVYNADIIDPRMTPDILSAKTVNNVSDIFDSTPTPLNGSVIVTCFESGLGSANQGVKTYALTLAQFRTMIQNITTSLYDSQFDTSRINSEVNSNFQNYSYTTDETNMMGALGSVFIHDIIEFLAEIMNKIGGFGSWRDNLLKAVYVPIELSDIPGTGSSKNIYLGFLYTGLSAKQVEPCCVKTKTSSIQIPWNGYTVVNHFLKFSKFSKFQVICCGGQYADLDPDMIRNSTNQDSLYVHTAIDVCSGDWSAVLTTDSSVNSMRLASFGGNLGIDITGYAGRGGLGAGMNYTMGGIKIAGSVLSMGLSNQAGAGNGDLAGSIGTGITSNFIQNNVGNTPSGMSSGGISSIFLNGSTGFNDLSIVGYLNYPAMIANSQADYIKYCQTYGYPSNRWVTLGDCEGFVKCEGASVECEGTQADIAFINNTLNSGAYIED